MELLFIMEPPSLGLIEQAAMRSSFFLFDVNCRWKPSCISALFSQSVSSCFMAILSLHAEQRHPTGNQWLVIRALVLGCVVGLVPKIVAVGRFQIESSCSVFSPNYLKRSGRKAEGAYFLIITSQRFGGSATTLSGMLLLFLFLIHLNFFNM